MLLPENIFFLKYIDSVNYLGRIGLHAVDLSENVVQEFCMLKHMFLHIREEVFRTGNQKASSLAIAYLFILLRNRVIYYFLDALGDVHGPCPMSVKITLKVWAEHGVNKIGGCSAASIQRKRCTSDEKV